jgi:ribonucleoside-diphosphate reductase alpha subunit
MSVVKRDGKREFVNFDKITTRIERLCWPLGASPTKSEDARVADDALLVDASKIAATVCASVVDGITTERLDELTADAAAGMSTEHPDYGVLAARIVVSNLQKQTSDDVLDTYERMASLLDPTFLEHVRANRDAFQSMVHYDRDFDFDYFGFKTMEKLYLTKVHGKIVERPQHMFLRVAVAIWGSDVDRVKETYDAMSTKMFTHASPTLFNAGLKNQQLSSCFLLGVEDDSIAGIYDALTKCAHISKYGGGIGMHISNVRCKGSKIRGTNGESDGIVPMAKVFDATAAYVNQGGRRKGAIALYLEPHHPDVFEFLDLKRNQGEDSLRARNLFYAMWLPDLFMKRVEADDVWSLFDPAECPDLNDLYGDEFEVAYERLESQRAFVRQIKAQDLWTAIVRSQIETGGPYVLFKDAANRKSNQKNLGTIKCSNLCTEIMEYTSKDEIAVCTLGSLSLPAFVLETPDGPRYDFDSLMRATKVLAKNLDRIIDINFYPLQEARNSNERHRPVGIGVQGLANVFFGMKMPFDSPEAAELNRNIFETIYYGSLLASNELAEIHGPYSSYAGSPASLGKLQYDLWKTVPTMYWDWEGLKASIAKHGLRNSLSVAPMPTASTAQFMSNVEAMEPQTSNLYSRRTLAGEFPVINTQLVRELIARGTWDVDMKNKIVAHGGSIQKVIGIHPSVKAVYKTAWEMSMKTIIDMAADRGAFVCQSQSLNCFVAEPTMKSLSSMHFYAWRKGLKTGCYYLRTKAASSAIKVTTSCLSCSG